MVLRHDVDELAVNALAMARLEHDMGIAASYYFRIVKQSNNPAVIHQIVQLGHEIGYHYEDLNKKRFINNLLHPSCTSCGGRCWFDIINQCIF